MSRPRVLFVFLLLTLAAGYFLGDAPEAKSTRVALRATNVSVEATRRPSSASPPSPVSPAAPASPTKATLSLEEEVEAEDACWAKMYAAAEPEKDFLAHHERDFCRTVGRWYFDSEAPVEPCANPGPSEKFFLALAKAGLLEGRKVERNDDEAVALLDEVVADDPSNSAPLLYEAMIFRRQNRTADEARIVDRIASATHFDSYLKSVTEAVYSEVQTPSDYLNAIGLWSRSPVPDYAALKRYLVDHQLGFVGDQMLDDTRRGVDRRETHWIPLEAAIGVSVLKLTDPGRRDLPNVRELLAEAQRQETNPRINGSHPPASCRLEDLAPAVDTLREEIR